MRVEGGGGVEMTNLCHKREAVEGSHYMRGSGKGEVHTSGRGMVGGD